jgi:AraC-like DNA-binding protein
MPVRYAEFAPAPPLAALVRCYWSAAGEESASAINRVLPDGCMDVIFDLKPDSSTPSFVVGAMLEASVHPRLGWTDFFGVRFVPGAATLFLDTRADELTDRTISTFDVWGDASSLIERLRAAALPERVRILDACLLQRLNERRRDELALRAMGLIERSRGLLTVASIRESLGTSERTLQRAFGNAVGLTPKQALRVARFRHALSWLARANPPALARIALLTGHTDQAHFNREFRELAGLAPRAWLLENQGVGFVQDDAEPADYPTSE